MLSTDERPVHSRSNLAAESVQRKAVITTRRRLALRLRQRADQEHPRQRSRRGIYWLARMLEGGEDVRFLCRRLVILASEDIGNADPHALPLAVAAMQACEFVGLPECQLTLAQAVTYLACAPKSNAATVAISEARSDVREGRTVPVPTHLRDKHYAGAKRSGSRRGLRVCPRCRGCGLPLRTIWGSSGNTTARCHAVLKRS